MVAQPAAAKPPDPGSSELSPLASPGEVAIQSSFRGNNWAPGRSAEAAAWVTAPAPAPRALPFGLIRRRCRKEGVNTFCVPGRLLAAPGISPVLFCLWTFVQTAPPHAESPPTRLYPSRSFPSVSLLRPHTLTEPSRPAQDGLCAFNGETLSSDPFFHPDVAPGVRLVRRHWSAHLEFPPHRCGRFLPGRVLPRMWGAPGSPGLPDPCRERTSPCRGVFGAP